MGKIARISARTILDSRGEETIEVEIENDRRLSALASVPKGKSVGSAESFALPARDAVRIIENDISPILLGRNIADQSGIDTTLCEADGTKNKSRFGGNAILGVSLAVVRLAAKETEQELWQYFRELLALSIVPERRPLLFANLISGGMHSSVGNLPFQEYLIIPHTSTYQEAFHSIKRLFETLASFYGDRLSQVGDEGGYGGNFEDPLEPFALFREAAEKSGITAHIRFGLDAAANNISLSNISEDALRSLYERMVRDYSLLYLEDPFSEKNEEAFIRLQNELPETYICGDDLTVTDSKKIHTKAKEKAIRSAIIKPNQIGSVSETLEAVRACYEEKIEPVISHRSGETLDSLIADLAIGVSAWGIKIGAPSQPERLSKYNRLIEIEQRLHV